ncbi:MAG: hypothetical protein IT495_15375 [Gammaproteobacteria bacterium]|nr:hypothetical protein [Gammaproteobacteria bacterium]
MRRLHCSVILATCVGLLPASVAALDLLPNIFGGDDGRVVWEGSDQYVRIVPQGKGAAGSVPPNDHPVELAPETLSTVLASVTLWREGGFFDTGDGETESLFTASQASLLGRKLSEALAQAKSHEDVTFAIMGFQSKLVVGKDRVSTAGRAFYQGGRLNLIIGDMHRAYEFGKEKDIQGIESGIDRRRFPHNPGRRDKARSHDARIMNTEGVEFHSEGGVLRGDWIAIDLKQALAAAEQRAVPQEIARETAKVKEEAAKLAIERRQMREELARMRQQMDDMRSGGAATESVEERLAKLAVLHEKNLISDEEYQARRRAILDEI